MNRFWKIILLSLCSYTCYSQHPAIKIESGELTNLYQVSDRLYRSDQPNKKAMAEIQALGIGTVLNLRNRKNDKKEAKQTTLRLERVAINAWKMDYEELLLSLKYIQQSEKPILVHCLHGSDRTGVVVAAYRMVFENWTRESAINEFLEPQFGFHAKWFPNLLALLENLDIEKCKKDLAN